MDTKIKAEWVKALRSGEYEQGRGKLQSDGKFCCLGVLCELSPVVHGTYNFSHAIVEYRSELSGDRDENYPPQAAWVWAGWTNQNPFVETGPGQCPDGSARPYYGEDGRIGHYLSNLNDHGFTFAQIADVISYFL
jgi:hypothetical protein